MHLVKDGGHRLRPCTCAQPSLAPHPAQMAGAAHKKLKDTCPMERDFTKTKALFLPRPSDVTRAGRVHALRVRWPEHHILTCFTMPCLHTTCTHTPEKCPRWACPGQVPPPRPCPSSSLQTWPGTPGKSMGELPSASTRPCPAAQHRQRRPPNHFNRCFIRELLTQRRQRVAQPTGPPYCTEAPARENRNQLRLLQNRDTVAFHINTSPLPWCSERGRATHKTPYSTGAPCKGAEETNLRLL